MCNYDITPVCFKFNYGKTCGNDNYQPNQIKTNLKRSVFIKSFKEHIHLHNNDYRARIVHNDQHRAWIVNTDQHRAWI